MLHLSPGRRFRKEMDDLHRQKDEGTIDDVMFQMMKQALEEEFAKIDGIANYSKTIEERVFLEYEEKTAWAFIKGVDERYQQVTAIDSSVDGTWLTSSEPQVVIGADISRKLNPGIFSAPCPP